MDTISLDEQLNWQAKMTSIDIGASLIESMSYLEAKELLESQTKLQSKKKRKLVRQFNRIVRSVMARTDIGSDECDIIIQLVWCGTGMKAEMELENRMAELAKYWRINEARKFPHLHEVQYNIDSAKAYPIETLYEGSLRQVGNRLLGLCPFHTERTPSFNIYPDTNTFHCFGCGAHGDSITFFMNQQNCDFKEALTILGGQQ